MITNQERRKFMRIPFRYPLTVRRMTMLKESQEQEMALALSNISAGGALFETSKIFEIGDVLLMKINIPGWERYKTDFIRPGQLTQSGPLTAIATVVRVELLKAGHYDIGVCFSGIDEWHQKALVKLIKKRQ